VLIQFAPAAFAFGACAMPFGPGCAESLPVFRGSACGPFTRGALASHPEIDHLGHAATRGDRIGQSATLELTDRAYQPWGKCGVQSMWRGISLRSACRRSYLKGNTRLVEEDKRLQHRTRDSVVGKNS
jgi:hypothetical protein